MPFAFDGAPLSQNIIANIQFIETEYLGLINNHSLSDHSYAAQLLSDLRAIARGSTGPFPSSCEPALMTLAYTLDPGIKVNVISQFHNYLMMCPSVPVQHPSAPAHLGVVGVDFPFTPQGAKVDARRRLARIFANRRIDALQQHHGMRMGVAVPAPRHPKQIIRAVPQSFNASADICCICQTPRENPNHSIVILPCCHKWLHTVCFDSFSQSYQERDISLECPLCRNPLFP